MILYVEQYELTELKKYFRDRQAYLPERLDFGHTIYNNLKKNIFDMLAQIDNVIQRSDTRRRAKNNAIYRANKGRLIEILKKLEEDEVFAGISFENDNVI